MCVFFFEQYHKLYIHTSSQLLEGKKTYTGVCIHSFQEIKMKHLNLNQIKGKKKKNNRIKKCVPLYIARIERNIIPKPPYYLSLCFAKQNIYIIQIIL